MPVRILSPNAREHLEEHCERRERVIEMAEGLPDQERLPLIPRTIEERIGLREWRSVLKSSFWEQTKTHPGIMKMHGGTAQDLFGMKVRGVVLLFENKFYEVSGPFDGQESVKVLLNWHAKQREELESPKTEDEFIRKAIPSRVKKAVWNRDGGKCVDCKSNHNLEYDHIIPVSKGGANTERNIQLLCETCNRKKGPKIE